MQNEVNPRTINEQYNQVEREFPVLLRAIRAKFPQGDKRDELLNAANAALLRYLPEDKLDALAQVRRDLSDRCPKCGEYDSCCCDLPAVEIVPEDQLPL